MQLKYNVLIVDDVVENIQIAMNILREENYNLTFALSGEEALKLIEDNHFDLILLDIMMPNMDGYELLQELKSDPELENIPVLIFSALKTPKSEQKVYELGADGFIVKPIDPKRMIEQIGKVLDRKKMGTSNLFTESQSDSELKLA